MITRTATFTGDGENERFEITTEEHGVLKVEGAEVDGEEVVIAGLRATVVYLDVAPDVGAEVVLTYVPAPRRRTAYGVSSPDTISRLALRAPYLRDIKAARARGDYGTANRLIAEMYQAEIDHGFRIGVASPTPPEPIVVPPNFDPYAKQKAQQRHPWLQKTPYYDLKRGASIWPEGATKVVAVAKTNDFRLKIFAPGDAETFSFMGHDLPMSRPGLYQLGLTPEQFNDIGAVFVFVKR